MSKKTKPSVATAIPEAPVEAPVPAEAAPKKKTAGFRLLAFLSFALCVAIVFLPITIVKGASEVSKSALFKSFGDWFKSDAKVLGFLPALVSTKGTESTLVNISFWVLLLTLVLGVILFLSTLFGGKKAPLRIGLFLVFLGAAFNVVAIYLLVKELSVFVLVLAVVALLFFILSFIKRREKAPEPEPVDPYADFHKEEYIEAYAYDGGPVAGVQVAEEVYPTVAAIEAVKDPDGARRNTVASLLGNGFDPFLIQLTEKEKNEFIDLYVLQCRGMMPEIPGYVVGGDNKDFFNKVFIYLGQYRDRIPADLLAKMYNHSMKI